MLGLSKGEPIGGVCGQESHDLALIDGHGQTGQVAHDVHQLLKRCLLPLDCFKSCKREERDWLITTDPNTHRVKCTQSHKCAHTQLHKQSQ